MCIHTHTLCYLAFKIKAATIKIKINLSLLVSCFECTFANEIQMPAKTLLILLFKNEKISL